MVSDPAVVESDDDEQPATPSATHTATDATRTALFMAEP
jgi:hypothetical protein